MNNGNVLFPEYVKPIKVLGFEYNSTSTNEFNGWKISDTYMREKTDNFPKLQIVISRDLNDVSLKQRYVIIAAHESVKLILKYNKNPFYDSSQVIGFIKDQLTQIAAEYSK